MGFLIQKHLVFSAIPAYSIPIGAWHVTRSFTLKDYNSTTALYQLTSNLKHNMQVPLCLLYWSPYHVPVNKTFFVHFCLTAIVAGTPLPQNSRIRLHA